MLPERTEDGRWRIGEKVFDTNAQAWRWLDRQNNEPISRSEDVGDWVARKILNKE